MIQSGRNITFFISEVGKSPHMAQSNQYNSYQCTTKISFYIACGLPKRTGEKALKLTGGQTSPVERKEFDISASQNLILSIGVFI